MNSNTELIQYRIDRSKETLAASKDLIKAGYYYDASSRMYFACFYVLLAYMHSRQLKAETHKGVRIHLHQELIKTGLVDEKYSKLYGSCSTGDLRATTLNSFTMKSKTWNQSSTMWRNLSV